MNAKTKIIIIGLLGVIAALIYAAATQNGTLALLEPKGIIALKQHRLILLSLGLMFIVVIPFFAAVIYIAAKYRAGNAAADYNPSWHSKKIMGALWGVSILAIGILSVINWNSTHELDPYKSIASDVKPITIQVVALRWKWLFIYPEQNIAAVNSLVIPEHTPIRFELTADDAPMNSFWVPELGGQMYAMAGMSTKLHLMANQTGEFHGSAAEINGAGFAEMDFKTKAVSQSDFESWVTDVKRKPDMLHMSAYNELIKPSKNIPPTYYSMVDSGLYNYIVMKYMSPAPTY